MLNGIVTASHSGFGSGPIMVSLLGSPQLAAPIRGLETTPAPVMPVRDTFVVTAPTPEPPFSGRDIGTDIAFAR